MSYAPPADLARRIEEDFGHGALGGICVLLQPLADGGLGDRIVRCVLQLAGGDVVLLRHYVAQALLDYGDFIS
ncbi:MAG: hypothetical protein FJ035_03350 [Chloroflexi bacterium]|nr:hypothetical protein [Chloroflexota bacterium]